MPQFMWYDMNTRNAAAAAKFYCEVVGWTAAPAGIGDAPYTVLSQGHAGVGGIYEMQPEPGGRNPQPFWLGYIAVDDVDAYTRRVVAAGGSVHKEPADLPEVGRFSVVADPQRAPFILFRPSSNVPRNAPTADAPGAIGRHDLYAIEPESALAFYTQLFAWKPQGYVHAAESNAPGAYWLFTFLVDEAAAAAQRVVNCGGRVDQGPVVDADGRFRLRCTDAQGAPFILSAGRR